ncbi:hypothetical protein GWK47_040825 [Chionoecetes opilio]|uniref:Uncharacterized protein n=1 Tax=Chionoecetes opilio TaxID=41210 RepID=A0A8J4YCY9_CHIOP|nr:hypothetical protein GWK47_040825 [Chionoecetes opilio]
MKTSLGYNLVLCLVFALLMVLLYYQYSPTAGIFGVIIPVFLICLWLSWCLNFRKYSSAEQVVWSLQGHRVMTLLLVSLGVPGAVMDLHRHVPSPTRNLPPPRGDAPPSHAASCSSLGPGGSSGLEDIHTRVTFRTPRHECATCTVRQWEEDWRRLQRCPEQKDGRF